MSPAPAKPAGRPSFWALALFAVSVVCAGASLLLLLGAPL